MFTPLGPCHSLTPRHSPRQGFGPVATPQCFEPAVPRHTLYLAARSLAERAAALVLLLIFTPLILVAAALVVLTSRGPAFYCQTRLGLRGRKFKVYKLRSMVQNAEAKTGATWCQVNDVRITPVGRLLRETHIDELPQLINVVLGEM